jgi:hypothetical protein
MLKRLSALCGLGLVALSAVGCSCAPGRYNVTVQLDDAMKQRLEDLGNRKIQVDLVAVNAKEHERWENYSMTQYWQPGDSLKGSIPTYSMVFSPKAAATQPGEAASTHTLTAKDPIWDKWYANTTDKDVMHLYVLALLPGTYTDEPGDRDPRRQILPLGTCRWDKNNILLKVQTTGIITVTTPKPEKQ